MSETMPTEMLYTEWVAAGCPAGVGVRMGLFPDPRVGAEAEQDAIRATPGYQRTLRAAYRSPMPTREQIARIYGLEPDDDERTA